MVDGFRVLLRRRVSTLQAPWVSILACVRNPLGEGGVLSDPVFELLERLIRIMRLRAGVFPRRKQRDLRNIGCVAGQ